METTQGNLVLPTLPHHDGVSQIFSHTPTSPTCGPLSPTLRPFQNLSCFVCFLFIKNMAKNVIKNVHYGYFQK